ncbi:discoidin domain-containing receptor 2 [Nilaparvata lugens]|uniref:discoidin domain-containing receptor 2 n=1 Tax=Nilaparvata lugens TaxID=108931 RepID=UPI00193E873E|nr:discoidin domain-containing receptor 2 [Nilaparvata lugens]XP_039286278.1 discoidin domain-containing receptor 2 [Nilaparvata lugens]XP_039286279.1 discoidin domain-containing receptor 2 [Nilaparvata lugens]
MRGKLVLMTYHGLTLLALCFRAVTALDPGTCNIALGMESGRIPDDDITASSSFDSGNVGPRHARVRTEVGGGAWCPKMQVTAEPKEWLEVDLHSVRVITAVETQGRFGNGQGQEYAEAYLLEYWRPRLGKWVRYHDNKGQEVMTGNTNTYLEARQKLDPPIWASRVRFLPYSYHMRTVCMRVELYGCPWTEGVVSYSMPQGDKRGSGWEFFDATYDGHWDVDLQRGLGQLTDGKFGPDSFKNAYYDYHRSQGWVGWRNDSRKGKPLEITFEFDQVREFTAIHLYCNNEFTSEVQVFSEIQIMFSIGGKIYSGNPISFMYMEDRIFEHSRNVSIKLHHRVGKYVKLRMQFAAKWIMISEVTFDSVVAGGNFTVESEEVTTRPVEENKAPVAPAVDVPFSTARQEDQTVMAVIIGVLLAVAILLGVAMLVIVLRQRQRKWLGSPLAAKGPLITSGSPLPGKGPFLPSGSPLPSKGSSIITPAGTTARDKATSTPDTALLLDLPLDEYQEPLHHYCYSSLLRDKTIQPSDVSHEYAVPEVGNNSAGSTLLIKPQVPPPSLPPARGTAPKTIKPPNQQDVLSALRRRLETNVVPEFPRHRVRMLSKLGEGAFRAVYVAEADGISDYGGSSSSNGKKLVAVKSLLHTASEADRMSFEKDVHILGALEDENIARVLGVCSKEEPLCVIMEYLPQGELCRFLRAHALMPGDRTLPVGHKTLSFNCLLYMATQIASGMRYLESLNFVHRDLAARNCLVGKAYQIKISDLGADNDEYAGDYYKMDNGVLLPIRWMAWESIRLGRYTTKSDVWSFGVTLWEILQLCRQTPYQGLSDEEVVQSLAHLHDDDGLFTFLHRPSAASKDIADLIAECWRRQAAERPSFREIHLFLQRKNLGFNPLT